MTGPEPPPNPWTLGPPPAVPLPAAPPGSWPGYYPVAPKPRRRWILWVALAAVLVVGGCAAVVGTVGVKAYRVLDGSKTAVDEYLLAVERGDQATAQRLRCDELLPETFATTLEPGITSHHVVGVAVKRSGGFGTGDSAETTATVTTEVTLGDGVRRRDEFTVVREHDQWLVCGIHRGGIG